MEPGQTQGQAAPADLTETTAVAPTGDKGQSISPAQTTSNGPDTGAQGESFFDPKTIEHDPNLMQAYKQMQGNFSKHMSRVRADQDKINQYNQAMADPAGTVRQLAARYGMTVVDGKPQAANGGEQAFAPKTWSDVVNHVRKQVSDELTQQYQPLVNQVKDLKQQNVSQYLDTKFPDWKTYETEMIQSLQTHPSLAQDPDLLYRMSVPPEILEARATARALERLRGGTDAGLVPGAKRATLSTSTKPTGPMTFDESVAYARSKLKEQGLRPVGG